MRRRAVIQVAPANVARRAECMTPGFPLCTFASCVSLGTVQTPALNGVKKHSTVLHTEGKALCVVGPCMLLEEHKSIAVTEYRLHGAPTADECRTAH